MQYLMAHDLGTSGNKAVLYTHRGELVAQAVVAYDTRYPFPQAAEQNPGDWWQAFCQANRMIFEQTGIAPGDILAVSFSAQMNSCLAVDQQGEALRPAMIWADQRAGIQAERLTKELGFDFIYQHTGQRLSAAASISKMSWLKENEPDIYQQAACFIQPKDYLICKLTGRLVSDYSDASHTACLDQHQLVWSRQMLDASGLNPEKMPDLLPSTAQAGTVSPQAAAVCGLLAGTPVITGGGDGPCATAGAGICKAGQTYVSLGTSAWISSLMDQPYLDQKMRTFNLLFLDGKQYAVLGTMQAAGLSVDWAVKNLYQDLQESEVYEQLEDILKQSPPGSEGLLFLPYLMGERSPWWNPDATGSFLGLTTRHHRGHMLRAVLEGVGHNLKLILHALEDGLSIDAITAVGGGARNKPWLKILSTLWQKPILIPRMLHTATSVGAALCAGVGVGVYPSLEAAMDMNPVAETLAPDPAAGTLYQTDNQRFIKAYQALFD